VAARCVCTFKLSDVEEVARHVADLLWTVRRWLCRSQPLEDGRAFTHARLRPDEGVLMTEHIYLAYAYSSDGGAVQW